MTIEMEKHWACEPTQTEISSIDERIREGELLTPLLAKGFGHFIRESNSGQLTIITIQVQQAIHQGKRRIAPTGQEWEDQRRTMECRALAEAVNFNVDPLIPL
jgi:hypothetical protein